MSAKDCSRYVSCSANLCPMDEGSLSNSWFPDEEICRNREYSKELWIQQQRKIAKKTRDMNTCYYYEMLNHRCVVGKGMTGIDPDCPYEDVDKAISRWFEKHPEIRAIPESERKEKSERMKRLQQEKKRSIRIENKDSDKQSA